MTQFPAQYLYTGALELWLLPSVDIRSKPTAGKAFLLPEVLLWLCVLFDFPSIYFIISSLILIVILNKWEDVITQFATNKSKAISSQWRNKRIRKVIWGVTVETVLKMRTGFPDSFLHGLHPSYSAQSSPDRLWHLYCCLITAKARLALHWHM